MTGQLQAFLPRVGDALRALDMARDVPRAPLMLRYLEQLQHWNKAYNLTAIRDPDQMLVQHLFDSLAVVPSLRAWRAAGEVRVADMGSGAGLPGIILAICQPRWRVVCVDAVQKKTAFIRQAAGVLGLANVTAVHGRIEAIEALGADLVISRAFASLADFVGLSERHLAPGGAMVAMKGRFPEEEVDTLEANTGWTVSGHVDLQVPALDAQRCLVYLGLKEIHDSR
ncbi:16S rRNA (guanine(527)-N(7))-methyltransferase RsmG [Castellaniella sp. GW247-6E4]|uniref:16S rRNA (guanine(527)-N(7))-methyltransferase RsmG n=1 Tax=Castellaniella sp. GW247-6E4 TaxID=3140380 RepID=UPI0033155AB6